MVLAACSYPESIRMTLQDDLARHWFQPMVPMNQTHKDQARPDPGPLTTRIEGELPLLDEPRTPAHPEPERLEVTQPYIPAISEQPPEFAKRLNPDRPAAAAAAERSTAPPARPVTPGAGPPAPPRQVPESPAAPQLAPEGVGVAEQPGAPTAPQDRPRKRRSLARRVVRRIIGPDLLRKDPAPKRR